MWSDFALSATVCVVLLFVPGALFLWGAGLRASKSFPLAPLLSVLVYSSLGVILPLFQIICSPLTLVVPYVSISLLTAIVGFVARRWRQNVTPTLLDRHRHNRGFFCEKKSFLFGSAALYLAIPLLTFWFLFYWRFGDPSFLIQGYDTLFHVNLVRSFINSGSFSSLSASLYMDDPSIAVTTTLGGFYPAGWHCLTALVQQIVPTELTVSINAVNYSLVSVVYPLGIWFLLMQLFEQKPAVICSGAFVVTCFSAFPWSILLRGEQFPQVMAFSLVPALLALVCLVSNARTVREKVGFSVICFCGLVALVFAQTNGVFTVGIFMAACFIQKSLEASGGSGNDSAKFRLARVRNAMILALSAIALWTVFFLSPFMRGVVSFVWEPTVDIPRAILNVALFSFKDADAFQPVLTLLMALGILFLLKEKGKRWILFPVAFVATAYVFSASTEGFLKHYLGGFWYTDPDRLGAMVAIFSVPIASFGIGSLVCKLQRVLPFSKSKDGLCGNSGFAASFCLSLVIVALVFSPSLKIGDIGQSTTFNSQLQSQLLTLTSPKFESILSKNEQTFADDVLPEMENGAIVNVPDDGSAFLYGMNDANMLYRRNYAGSSDETESSKLIREALVDIERNPSVQQAIREIGAKYVLVLDAPGEAGFFHSYKPEEWKGIQSIDEGTPGFDLVASKDDMKVFRIQAAD